MLIARCAYLGFSYRGFQKQPNVLTIQHMLQEAFKRSGYSGAIKYASRTDAGVSAIDQVIALRTENREIFMKARNELPADIRLYAFLIY